MKIEKDRSGGYVLHVNNDEMLIINNALNEVCNGFWIDDIEFQTRVGVERAEASAVLRVVNDALKQSELH